ncbi:MAG: DGQHR domain-containing protein [Thermoplasmata archaeon]
MLATRVRQKEGMFYLVNYKARDLLDRVRFISRFYFEGEELEGQGTEGEDDIVKFIAKIEKNDRAFQRGLIKRKVKDIVNFYETTHTQPLIPGTVLLFTDEKLNFEPIGKYETIGNLQEPKEKFHIIDGQHRLAGLYFFRQHHPEEIDRIEVPAIIFDKQTSDFAAEMFVIINSTHTKISKSHLVDLMEKVTWETPEKKFAAKIVKYLYEDQRSPLQYKINKLGGRSRQEKWILQSELFNEIYKLVMPNKKKKELEIEDEESLRSFFMREFDLRADRAYNLIIDFLKAVQNTMGGVWGRKGYMFTSAVTIKALIRVLGDLLQDKELRKEWRENKNEKPFEHRIAKWKELEPMFRAEGFYERFPAKGQIERVRRIHTELKRAIGLS